MNTAFKDTVLIQTITSTVTGGDTVETLNVGDTVRCHIHQISGTRFVNNPELVDKVIYKIECFDNSYSDNIVITYNAMKLRPIEPIIRNRGESNLNEIIINAAVKK